jgi:hypothetical protein
MSHKDFIAVVELVRDRCAEALEEIDAAAQDAPDILRAMYEVEAQEWREISSVVEELVDLGRELERIEKLESARYSRRGPQRTV